MSRIFIILVFQAAAAVLFTVLATMGSGNENAVNQGGGASALDDSSKVLRLAIDTDPKTLDPISITDTLSDGVARKIHNTLVRFETDPGTGALYAAPDLAEKFDISPDGKLYTFTLRKGVRFHNGREMRAEDVVYSLSRLLSPESRRPEWLKPTVVGSEARYKDPAAPLGIKAVLPYVVTIELNSAFAPFLMQLCTVNCAVVPREAVEDKSRNFARQPVGTGAFILSQWRNNERLVLTRNPGYFKGRPKLDAVEFRIIKDANNRMELFFQGELHAASDLPNGRVREALQRAGLEDSLRYSTLRTSYIGFGMPNGDFKDKAELRPFGTDKRLRQAFSYALDRQYLCETVLEERGTPARGVLPPGMPGFTPGRAGWPKDLAKARALLEQAGFPGGKGLPVLPLYYRHDKNQKKIAQVVAEDLRQIGVQVSLQPREWNSFLEMVESEPRPAFMLGWVADYPDPDNFLYVLFNSKQIGPKGNDTWYANPEVDVLTEKAQSVVEMSERIALYRKAEDIILDECPWVCTYHVVNEVLLSRKVKGIREHVTPLDTGTEFPQVDFAFVDIE